MGGFLKLSILLFQGKEADDYYIGSEQVMKMLTVVVVTIVMCQNIAGKLLVIRTAVVGAHRCCLVFFVALALYFPCACSFICFSCVSTNVVLK